ncbi:leucine-rich repeat protein 1 isoform X3 [Microtus pennsylvanicus]|uniref:leucine-rich repeat protein 1 isoform X3 n=1 Tax=Microtus pennsylvanicus TaxID=10058 RepID=UPI003F6CEE62
MRLPCEVEVLSRHLPVLGLKSRGKGVRAVVSLCQAPHAESGGRACLLVSTMKDKRGTRYELKENIEQLFNKFVDEGKATVRLKEPPVDICLSQSWQFKEFTFSCKNGSQRL